jgi:hypothetical protein
MEYRGVVDNSLLHVLGDQVSWRIFMIFVSFSRHLLRCCCRVMTTSVHILSKLLFNEHAVI